MKEGRNSPRAQFLALALSSLPFFLFLSAAKAFHTGTFLNCISPTRLAASLKYVNQREISELAEMDLQILLSKSTLSYIFIHFFKIVSFVLGMFP